MPLGKCPPRFVAVMAPAALKSQTNRRKRLDEIPYGAIAPIIPGLV